MPDETPLPLARMATINKPSFWIFTGACIALYIYNKIIPPDTGDAQPYVLNSLLIFLAVFLALFLNLITMLIKNAATSRTLNIVCYVFEAASIILLATRIFFKW